MATIQTGAGVVIGIATVTTEVADLAAYEALTYTPVEQTESIGDYGDSTNEVTFTGLGDARVQKKKGAADAGNLSVTMAFDGTGGAGQAAIIAAAADTTSTDYHFEVVFNDDLGANATTRYFSGQVASAVESVSGADSIIMLTCEIRINTAILKKAAAA